MRKLLLFALAFGVSTLGFSQNVNSFEKVNTQKITRTVADDGSFHGSAPVNKNKSEKSGTIQGIQISSSGNVYGYLVENQSCLTANEDIGVIHFTHRADPNVIGVSTGDIISSQSRDGGWTWTQMMAYPDASGFFNRYPGGQLYNPIGNSDPDNAYVIVAGPSHDGVSTPVWQHMFVGSMQLDSSNFDRQYLATNGAIVRMGFQGTSNGKFYVISSNYQSPAPYALDTILLYEGSWDNTNHKVDWTINKFDANFVIGSDGGEFAYVWGFNTAWSADGTTGYYWTIGRDSSNDTRSYQPIVWKSADSGANWAKMPVFDFSGLSTITDELRNMGDTAIKRPQFNGAMDGTVDANGNLHLVCKIASAFSNNDDSLDYSYTQTFEGMPGHNTIFDVYTTSTGWTAKKLGYVYTIDVADADSPYGSGTDAIGWDLRLQAGRTTDGTKVFASWTDTDTSFALTNATGFKLNSFPDIHYAGVNVTTGAVIADVNYTEGTALAGDCFFHYMSDIILTNASGDNIIPLTELDLGTTPTDAVTINYVMLTGVGFDDNAKSNASVSQNRPNPFSGITNIEVTLTESANLSIEVMNLAGQKVSETNYGTAAVGLHSYQIDATNLSAGMYFYTVRVGNNVITKKMIVR